MYRIYTEPDYYRCECDIQDGTERWKDKTLKEAIKNMKYAAKSFNNTEIKKKDIEIYICRILDNLEWIRVK